MLLLWNRQFALVYRIFKGTGDKNMIKKRAPYISIVNVSQQAGLNLDMDTYLHPHKFAGCNYTPNKINDGLIQLCADVMIFLYLPNGP